MNVDRATSVSYRCLQCRRIFSFSFQKFLFGPAKCPFCSQEHFGVILNEPTYPLDYRDYHRVLRLSRRLN